MYDENRNLIQTGDPIEWRSNTLLGMLIRIKSDYINHTSAAIRLPVYYKERLFQIEALEHGVVLTGIHYRLEHHRGKAWVRLLREELDDLRTEIGRILLDFVGTQIKYDYKGAFIDNLFGKAELDKRRLYCTEAWYYAVKYAVLSHGSKGQKMLIEEADDILEGKAPIPSDVRKLGLTQGIIKIK